MDELGTLLDRIGGHFARPHAPVEPFVAALRDPLT